MNEDTNQQQETPQYVTKDDFGKTASIIRNLSNQVTQLTSFLDSVGEKSEDGTYRLKAQSTATPKPQDKTPEWQTELNQMKTELKKRDDLIAEKDRKAADSAKRSAIQEALAKAGARNPKRDVLHILDAVKTSADGKYVASGQDANGLDTEIALEAFINDFLKANPELANPQIKPGSGTPVLGGSTSVPGKTVEDLAGLSESDFFKAMDAQKKHKR